MKTFYKEQWEQFKNKYLMAFLVAMIVSLVAGIGVYAFLLANSGLLEMVMGELEAQFSDLGVQSDTGHQELFWVILLNNLQVSLLVVLLGFIPIVVLPLLSPIATAGSVSVVMAYVQIHGGESPLPLFVTGILPHGIIEMVGLFLASAVGIVLSIDTAKKLFTEARRDIRLSESIHQAFKMYIGVVAPLIVLAALIEGFITPLLLTS
ncbi:stage II sporulation protein M [Salsuginibacillus kocurii]|uniref:stage II sporulation protein M n=1 Tax=Salsuginibacillus kocurii TaxID=427078 RepID=UPI000365A4F7|nr:stage II sporulation protein M [Salsuginibacillus kocurii]